MAFFLRHVGKADLLRLFFLFCANVLKMSTFTGSTTDFASYYLRWTYIRKRSVLSKDKPIYNSILSVQLMFLFF